MKNEQTGLYTSRYYAKKEADGMVTVKVCGGYKNMTFTDYQVWINQK